MSNFSTTVNAARRCRHLTYAALGALLDYGTFTIRDWMVGRYLPPVGMIASLADVLGLPADLLYLQAGLLPPDVAALVTSTDEVVVLSALGYMRYALQLANERGDAA